MKTMVIVITSSSAKFNKKWWQLKNKNVDNKRFIITDGLALQGLTLVLALDQIQ